MCVHICVCTYVCAQIQILVSRFLFLAYIQAYRGYTCMQQHWTIQLAGDLSQSTTRLALECRWSICSCGLHHCRSLACHVYWSFQAWHVQNKAGPWNNSILSAVPGCVPTAGNHGRSMMSRSLFLCSWHQVGTKIWPCFHLENLARDIHWCPDVALFPTKNGHYFGSYLPHVLKHARMFLYVYMYAHTHTYAPPQMGLPVLACSAAITLAQTVTPLDLANISTAPTVDRSNCRSWRAIWFKITSLGSRSWWFVVPKC